MKKRIAIVGSILVAATLVAVPLVYAQQFHRAGHHGGGFGGGHAFGFLGGRHLEHLADELDLSQAQVDQIKAIYAELHEQNAQYRESMHGGFKAIAETLLKDPNDTAAAQALIDQQAAAEKAMKTNMLNATSRALNVLTADQRAELGEKLQQFGERRERRRK